MIEDGPVPAASSLESRASSTSAWAPWQNRGLLLKIGLFMLITTAVVVGLLGWAGASDVLGLILNIGWGHLLIITLMTLTLPFTHAWRTRAVLGAIGYEVGARRMFNLTMAAWPISSITPSKSGDLVKAYYLRNEVPATATVGSLLTERAVDVATLSSLSLLGSFFFNRTEITLFSAAVLACVLGFFVVAPWIKRLPLKRAWIDRVELLLSSTYALSRLPRLFAITVGVTLVNCAATVLVTAVLFDAVGAKIPLLFTVAALPPAMFAGLMPLTLGGMGTRDSMLILLFEQYASTAQSLSVGILYAFFFRWLLSLLGIPFLQRLMREGAPTGPT